ncbi:hypothetical protein CAEBREN_02638 [Caenorhabditis brenneri]|uniref:Uncharacterized protein n=1 Tax=Caenorhabditis brenneri TaxID=135651 RepID=G0P9W1_CAEBE|nr:hypothetical protein CAEBREN_02638 [Caenorhabditis brenneri]
MDKFVIRSKRKTPATSSEKPTEESKEKVEKVAKVVPKKAKKEETEDEKMLAKLRTESRMSKEAATLDGLLPTIKREPGKAISDADLEKLFFALCGDTGKKYDSDDSLISEIDFMDAEEIAAKDKQFRDVMEYIRNLPEQQKRLLQINRIGQETPEEREERRRVVREIQMEHKTQSERDRAEKKRLAKIKRAEKRLNSVVDVFGADLDKIVSFFECGHPGTRRCGQTDNWKASLLKKNPEAPSLLTARQFSRCLEVMAECVGKDQLSEDGHPDIQNTVKEIDVETLNKSLKSAGIKAAFFCDNKTPAEYLKKRVRKLFVDDNILDVLDGDRYGFEFNTKDCLNALVNYYNENSNAKKRLTVKIRPFVTCSYYVARGNDSNFKLNDDLKYAMFG